MLCNHTHIELCDEIGILENGIITYEQDFTTSRKPARTVAVYSCNQGYQLNGLEKRVCQGSSGWSGTIPPQCKGIWISSFIVRTFISSTIHCTVFSCMIEYPGTGCAPSSGSPLLGGSPNPRCSCHMSCFSNSDTCCEDIGCVRKCTFACWIPHDSAVYNLWQLNFDRSSHLSASWFVSRLLLLGWPNWRGTGRLLCIWWEPTMLLWFSVCVI